MRKRVIAGLADALVDVWRRAQLPFAHAQHLFGRRHSCRSHVRDSNLVTKQPAKPKYEFPQPMLYAAQRRYDGARRRRGSYLASRPNSRNG
jgi:hypothetical protein